MASSNQSAPQDRVTGSAGALTSKPEISAGHPITKAFLPHQRVTTEGKAMEFKKGDVVTWSSQAAGSWKTKTGVITEVWEYKKQTRYTVKVDPKEGSTAKPKFYYPRTSALQKVS